MSTQYIYFFGAGQAEGHGKGKELLGGKGVGLAEMTALELPVPPGFTVTTEVCNFFYEHEKARIPRTSTRRLRAATSRRSVSAVGARFGDPANPLLVSVRSGARASMPGMMDTVLNLGLNDATVEGLIKKTGNPRFAWDSYRRFVAMYGDVVMGHKPASDADPDPFEQILDEKKAPAQGRARSGSQRRRSARPRDALQSFRQGLPRRSLGAAARRDRRGLQELGEPARPDLPRDVRLPVVVGHGCQCAVHGLWQYGRGLRDGRRLYPRSVDRRAQVLWRVPDQRPGRGRRRGHPHSAADRRARRRSCPTRIGSF